MDSYNVTVSASVNHTFQVIAENPKQASDEAEGRLYNYLYEAVDSFGQIQATKTEIQSEVGEISQHQRDWMDKHTNN